MGMVEITNVEEFKKEVLEASDTVVVDFNADWCGPCQMLRPILDFVANEQAKAGDDSVKFASVNIDVLPEIAEEYEVSGIPCLIKFENGTETDRAVGLISQKKLGKFVGIKS